MKKIDGHVHLIRALAGLNGKGRLTPLGDGKAIFDDGEVIQLIPKGWGTDQVLAESFLKVMARHEIERAVLLQGSLNGYQNYYSYQVVKRYPEKFIAAFAVDPFAKEAETIVKRYVETLGFRALKLEISEGGGLHGYHRPFSLATDPKVAWIMHYLAAYPGFVIVVDYGASDQLSYQPEALAELAKRYPQLDFVVCHLSFPNAKRPAQLKNALQQFAPYPNIVVDLSALQDIEGETKADFPYPRCQQDVLCAKEILGVERLLWGTDSPWSATFNSYEQLATWLEKSGLFTPKELQAVMYENAKRIYFKPAHSEALRCSVDPALKKIELPLDYK